MRSLRVCAVFAALLFSDGDLALSQTMLFVLCDGRIEETSHSGFVQVQQPHSQQQQQLGRFAAGRGSRFNQPSHQRFGGGGRGGGGGIYNYIPKLLCSKITPFISGKKVYQFLPFSKVVLPM